MRSCLDLTCKFYTATPAPNACMSSKKPSDHDLVNVQSLHDGFWESGDDMAVPTQSAGASRDTITVSYSWSAFMVGHLILQQSSAARCN